MAAQHGDVDKPRLRKNEIAGILAAAEDGVYEAAGLVAQEARVVEKLAQGVEKVSDIVEHEVDKVEPFVHEVDLAAQAIEASALHLDDVSQGMISSKTPQPSLSTLLFAKDIMDMGWKWNILRISIVLLTFPLILRHTWGSTNKISPSDQKDGGMTKGASYTILTLLAVNLGPIVKLVNFVKNTISNEQKILKKVEGNVNEVVQDVHQTLGVVKRVAHVVEDASHKVEEDAEHLQKLLKK